MFNKTIQENNTHATLTIGRTCEDSFFVRVRSIIGSLENHEASMDEVPMKWILGDKPHINGKEIEVLQLVGEINVLYAEVRYKA